VTLIRDLAYADDLLTLAATLAILTKKAELVQAFADLFGLEIAHQKLSGYAIRYDIPMEPLHHPTPTHDILLPRPASQTFTIPLKTVHPSSAHAPTLKYLGITFDLNLSSNHQLTTLQARIRTATMCVRSAKASHATKRMVLQLHVSGTLNYFAPMLQGPLQRLQASIDPILDLPGDTSPVTYPLSQLNSFVPPRPWAASR